MSEREDFKKMVLGLVHTAELHEEGQGGNLWDDRARRALASARALGWGRERVGELPQIVERLESPDLGELELVADAALGLFAEFDMEPVHLAALLLMAAETKAPASMRVKIGALELIGLIHAARQTLHKRRETVVVESQVELPYDKAVEKEQA